MDVQEGADILILWADDPIPVYSDICTYCRHWHVGPGHTCAAFPEGIPMPIWLGENNHRAPYEGDHGVQFTAKNAAKSALKVATDDPRTDAERRLMAALEALFAKLLPDLAARIAGGEMPDEATLQAAFRRVIEPQLIEAAVDEFERLGVSVGVQFDPAAVSREMMTWAQTYTLDLVTKLTDTTRPLLQDALARFQTTPGMTRGELEALIRDIKDGIKPAFSATRAEAISVTEVTRAYSAAMTTYANDVEQAGIPGDEYWLTSQDELVCGICGPLHNQSSSEWKDRFPGGPPAHTRCRCSKRWKAR